MRVARELLQAFVTLIALFLVLDKATGFTKDIGAVGKFVSGTARTFQGR
jgi:hypothetical protein